MRLFYLFMFMNFSFLAKAQQSADTKKTWELLKPGMSDVDVKKLIGEPNKSENFTTVKRNTFDTSTYWRYPNNVVVVITNHLFERVEKNREDLLRSIQQNASKKDNGLIIVPNGKK
jgi:hypothetical protein